jgi:hypothetical protein
MDTAQPDVSLAQVLEELKDQGVLLTTDSKLPSVCAMVAGEPVRGSWWAHPRSHAMFHMLTELAAHPDVLVAKLVSGKDTFIYKSLWPAVLAVGTAHEKWQMEGLDQKSRVLLAEVEKKREVQASGKSALRLEQALLVHGEQVHTDAGSHAKILVSWLRWAERTGVKSGDLPVADAKASLEKLLEHLNRRYSGRGRVPWA